MINCIIITAARCAPENRQMALSHMAGFASELISKTGTLRCRYGVTMAGLVSGALVFVQMYESLAEFEKAIDVMSQSSAYASMLSEAMVDVYARS